MEADQIPVVAIAPEDFARSVAATKDKHLAEGMRGPLREQVLDEIFRRMEEHFEPSRAGGLNAVIRFRIGGRADSGYDRYDVEVRAGEIAVEKDRGGKPSVTLTMGAVEFLKLATGNANGTELFLRRKVKVKGDLLLAGKVAGLFRIPSSKE